MKNRGSTPILTNLVGAHPRNIHKNLKQIRAAVQEREVNKTKRRTQGDIARVTHKNSRDILVIIFQIKQEILSMILEKIH